MGEEQRQALARLFAEDEAFRADILSAASADDAVRIAAQRGIAATAEDFVVPGGMELSAAELDGAAGGAVNQIWPTAPWVAC